MGINTYAFAITYAMLFATCELLHYLDQDRANQDHFVLP